MSHIFLDNKLFENVLNHVEKDLFIKKKLFSNKNNKRKKQSLSRRLMTILAFEKDSARVETSGH